VTLLLLKLLLAPALVVGTSLAGRRWGPQVAAVLVTLPIVAGPILVVLVLEQGAAFASRAAGSALLGLVATGVFGVTFAAAARRLPWAATLAVSWVAVLAVDLALYRVRLPVVVGLVVAIGAMQGSAALLRRRTVIAVAPPERWPWWDLPARAVATAALVLAVTGSAALLGPGLAGILTPFPIAVSVVCGFVLAEEGSAAAVVLLEGVLRGMTGFAVFCFGVAVLLTWWPVAWAFVAATAAGLAVPLLSGVLSRWREPGPAAARAPR
jgi:hypothetical protein